MDRTVTCALLLLSASATLGKYVYVNKRVTWPEAQAYCRLHHTDLAPVGNKRDSWLLSRLVYNFYYLYWIGLERSPTDREKWMWSGGGEVSTFFWHPTQPENKPPEIYGAIGNHQWHDVQSTESLHFFCYRAVVVRERKTWEEAVEYCREHHEDLASVTSETEMLLIQREMAKNATTGRVWIGLHFFPGGWLWTDKQRLSYEAWGRGGQPECPSGGETCAAIRTTGGNGTDFGVNTFGPSILIGGTNGATAGAEHVWEAHDCAEKLHFICY